MTTGEWNFGGLRALFINCTLKRSPEVSNTEALVEASRALMEGHGVATESLRLIDHDVATGVWPDMTEHGWATDDWPQIQERVFAADILVLAGPIWLGDNSSVMKTCIERLYATSHLLNSAGQYAYYGRVAGCLITGNEDGIKHCAMNILYSLQHLGYTIPPQADAGWIGEAGPGPSYLDPGSGGPGKRLHEPQHDVHDLEPDAPRATAPARRRLPGPRQPALGLGRRPALRLGEPRVPALSRCYSGSAKRIVSRVPSPPSPSRVWTPPESCRARRKPSPSPRLRLGAPMPRPWSLTLTSSAPGSRCAASSNMRTRRRVPLS